MTLTKSPRTLQDLYEYCAHNEITLTINSERSLKMEFSNKLFRYENTGAHLDFDRIISDMEEYFSKGVRYER